MSQSASRQTTLILPMLCSVPTSIDPPINKICAVCFNRILLGSLYTQQILIFLARVSEGTSLYVWLRQSVSLSVRAFFSSNLIIGTLRSFKPPFIMSNISCILYHTYQASCIMHHNEEKFILKTVPGPSLELTQPKLCLFCCSMTKLGFLTLQEGS